MILKTPKFKPEPYYVLFTFNPVGVNSKFSVYLRILSSREILPVKGFILNPCHFYLIPNKD